jgi:hypothetical protein
LKGFGPHPAFREETTRIKNRRIERDERRKFDHFGGDLGFTDTRRCARARARARARALGRISPKAQDTVKVIAQAIFY